MADFYYNRDSPQTAHSQWRNYLQNQSYAADITSGISNQTNEYKKSIAWQTREFSSILSQCSKEQVHAIQDSARIVSKTIEAGFEQSIKQMEMGFDRVTDELYMGFSVVSNHLSSINSAISELTSLIDWRMSMMIEQQRINNILSENIALLLRIPDFQKKRIYYIEQGLKHLKNATKDQDLYNNALNNFLKAEEEDTDNTDYFVLHRIGMIYQYVPDLLDETKAEKYFRKAAKYAFAESHPDSARLFNILTGDINNRLKEQSTPEAAIQKMAAESFFHAGISCYSQGKFDEAAELTGKAFQLAPEMLEAGFTYAKCLAASNKVANAIPILKQVISIDKDYSKKITTDLDLVSKVEVRNLLAILRSNVNQQANEQLERGKALKSENSEVKEILQKIEELIRCNTYLEGLQALDELSKKRNWKINYLNVNDINTASSIITNEVIISVCFSPDREILATGQLKNSTINLYETHSGRSLNTLTHGDSVDTVGSICFSPDGTLLASSGGSTTITIWDVKNCRILRTLIGGTHGHISVCFSPDGKLLASGGIGATKLWDVNTGKEILNFADRVGFCRSVSFSSDGLLLAAAIDEEIKILEVNTKKVLHTIDVGKSVESVSFSAYGMLLASCSTNSNTIEIFDVNRSEKIKTLYHYKGMGKSVCFCPLDNLLASAGSGGINLWDIYKSENLITLEDKSVAAICFSSDGRLLASGGYDKAVKIWNLYTKLLNIYDYITFEQEQMRLQKEDEKEIARKLKEKQDEEAQKIKEIEEAEHINKLRTHLEAKNLLKLGREEETKQDKKWMFKDYSSALTMYERAIELGLQEAVNYRLSLKKKMK